MLVFFDACILSQDFFVFKTPFILSVLLIDPSAELLFKLSLGENFRFKFFATFSVDRFAIFSFESEIA